MDHSFAEWYRVASIETSNDLLKKRWEGVERAAETISDDLDLVRLLFGHPLRRLDIATFRQPFFDADATFRMDGKNDLELRALAAAVIASRLTGGKLPSSGKEMTAWAVLASDCFGMTKRTLVPDLVKRCGHILTEASLQSRKLVAQKSSISRRSVDEAIKSLEASPTDASATSAATARGLRELSKTVQQLSAITQSHNVLAEETNILWWLVGGVSALTKTRFEDCGPAEAALYAGHELSGLVTSQTGPSSADAILDRATQGQKKPKKTVSLGEIVLSGGEAIHSQLLEGWAHSDLLDFCPMHFALTQLEQIREVDAALAATAALFSIKLSNKAAPVHWASQFYHECMLRRASAS